MSNKISNDMPFVSIIIPVYKDEAGLRVCLQEIARQTYPRERIEVIAVDNNEVPTLVLGNDDFVTVCVVPCTTPGSYAARNAGARKARGEIFAFTDADCRPCADWLEQGVRALLEGAGRCVVGGEVEMLEPVRFTGVSLYQYATGFHQQANIENKGFSVTANLFCMTDQFERIGPFDERLLSGGDREWAWRAAAKGVGVIFERQAVVRTPPRTTLRSAFRQARRVAAGRYYLRRYGLDHLGAKAIVPHRSIWQSLFWVLTLKRLSLPEKLKVFNAAVLIKGVTMYETLRLRLGIGGELERR